MKNKSIVIILSATMRLLVFLWWPFLMASGQSKLMHLSNASYSVEYDIENHVPVKVDWVLHKADFEVSRKRVAKYFKADGRLPKPRVKDGDYIGSGYMRGHMCSAADRRKTRAMMKETFIMSNVAPQSAALNCGKWSELEAKTRRLAVVYDSVKVQVRALFLCSDSIYIGRGLIRVPSHFSREVRVAKTDSLLFSVIVSQFNHSTSLSVVPE